MNRSFTKTCAWRGLEAASTPQINVSKFLPASNCRKKTCRNQIIQKHEKNCNNTIFCVTWNHLVSFLLQSWSEIDKAFWRCHLPFCDAGFISLFSSSTFQYFPRPYEWIFQICDSEVKNAKHTCPDPISKLRKTGSQVSAAVHRTVSRGAVDFHYLGNNCF